MKKRPLCFQPLAAYGLCLLVSGFCVLLHGARGFADEVQTLPATIAEGITLLEEKKYEAFLGRFPVPEELDRMRKNRSMEELARTFSKQHAPRLLGMLRQIQSKEPQLSDEGQRAEYRVDWKNFSQNKLVFLKISGRWYLHN
mgnify:FL=1|jgi:hypothetical protein